MTNTQIIANELTSREMTDAHLQQLLTAYHGDLPYHTFAQWKAMGYSVKRGEHALFACYLWKHTSKPGRAARDAAELAGEDVPENDPHFYKAKAHIFAFTQVKRIGAPDPEPAVPAPCTALIPAPCVALVPISTQEAGQAKEPQAQEADGYVYFGSLL